MNIQVNPHWRALKTRLITDLGYDGAYEFLRFAAHSVRNIGERGAAEHFEFAAAQIQMEGRRASQAA